MSALLARMQDDLNAARKAQDKPLVMLLGTVLADVKNRRIELRRDPSDDEVVEVLRKAIKRRRESVEMYLVAARPDLVAKETTEVEVLERYLPPAPSDDELRTAVRSAIGSGAATIGTVMGKVMPQFKGRVDGSQINAIAREELGRQG